MSLLRRTLIAAALAALLVGLSSTSSDASHSRGKCEQRGEALLKNDSGRVSTRADARACTRSRWSGLS